MLRAPETGRQPRAQVLGVVEGLVQEHRDMAVMQAAGD
jgi:hypothetical protein